MMALTNISPRPGLFRRSALVSCVACILFSCLFLRMNRPPVPLPADAPAGEFSAVRAFAHIERFAKVPHRAGTEANVKVRDYLVSALRELGGEPTVQTATAVRGRTVGTVDNVLARLPGTVDHDRAFMLMAHYDSVPYGPGAADDGAGVAALLETFRALKASPPLRNDVIFFFPDAEERGLLGAKAFLQHPWASDVALLINFDARGTSGLSYLYETGPGNGGLIPHIARALASPHTSSVMFEVYKRMPVTSDYRVLKEFFPGMNAAFIDRLAYYHSGRDSPGNLDLASLQHHGVYALSTARYFGNLPLGEIPSAPDAVWFDILGLTVVHYPGSWTVPLTLGVLTLFFTILGGRIRSGSITAVGTFHSFGVILATMCGSSLISTLFLGIAFSAKRFYFLYNSDWFATAFIFATVGGVLLVFDKWREKGNVEEFRFGAFIWWAAVMALASFRMPGSGYIFHWPFLAALVGFWLASSIREEGGLGWSRPLVGLLFLLPALAIHVPMLASLFDGLSSLGSPLILPGIVFLLCLVLPAACAISFDLRFPAKLAILVGTVLFVFGLFGRPIGTRENPLFESVVYALDAADGRAWWASGDEWWDGGTGGFFASVSRSGSLERFHYKGNYRLVEAPVAVLPPPTAVVESDVFDPARGRRLTLRLASPRRANRVKIYGKSAAETSFLKVDGRFLPTEDLEWSLDYSVFPASGIRLEIGLVASKPLDLEVLDISYGLPEMAGFQRPPRPDSVVPKPNTITLDHPFESDTCQVRNAFRF